MAQSKNTRRTKKPASSDGATNDATPQDNKLSSGEAMPHSDENRLYVLNRDEIMVFEGDASSSKASFFSAIDTL